jgi:alpha-beta hydrolase superfamily lysophospholipase
MIQRRALLGAAALLAATSGRLPFPHAGSALSQTAQAPSMPPPYFPQGSFERPVRFAGMGGVTLAGTLLLPAIVEIERVPGVVLVAGSGPTDRDGNNPLIPVRVDLLKEIAELLAGAGIASLRYDKRGIGQSTPRPTGLAEQKALFTWGQFVDDVRAAHAELLRHDEIKTYATALLGHSEGGLLALAATPAMSKARPYCLVLTSTPGRPLDEIVRAQIKRRLPEFSAAADRIIAVIRETGEVPTDESTAMRSIFPAYAGGFLRDAFAFDPALTLAGTTLPCLVLQGGADTQVMPPNDVQPLIDALSHRTSPGEAMVVPNVSHNLKLVSGPGDPGFAGPLAPAIAAKLASWLRQLLGA